MSKVDALVNWAFKNRDAKAHINYCRLEGEKEFLRLVQAQRERYSLKQIADQLKITRSYLSMLINGKRSVTEKLLWQLITWANRKVK